MNAKRSRQLKWLVARVDTPRDFIVSGSSWPLALPWAPWNSLLRFTFNESRRAEISLGGVPLSVIEEEHCPIQWNGVRVIPIKQAAATVLRSASSADVESEIDRPQRQWAIQPAQQSQSVISSVFEDIYHSLDSGDIAKTRELVSQLQGSLETTSGVVARPNVGGVQFRAEYVLDSVLCSDSLRDSSLLDPVVRQSLSLAVHPDLKDHLLSQGLRLPKRSTIYHFRVDLEYCSLLWARDHLWVPNIDWILHFRTDSSPQFSRNYLVAEADRVSLECVSPLSYKTALSDVVIVVRLLPLQVLGKRATDTSFKYAAACRMFALESHDPDLMRDRTCSTLFDFGVEFQLSILQTVGGNRVFKKSLPLCDMDHGLHHTAMTVFSTFDDSVFDSFDRHVCTLAKFFSKRDCCDFFVEHCIMRNDKIKGMALKRSLAVMFERTCPSYYKERWGFYFEVLQWIAHRFDALSYLNSSVLTAENALAITETEAEAFKQNVQDPIFQHLFRAMIWTVFLLMEWVKSVSAWFHWCPCCPAGTKTPCQMRGRRLIESASGAVNRHLDKLATLIIGDVNSTVSMRAYSALQTLEQHAPSLAQLVRQGFFSSKAGLCLRYKQAASFLHEGKV